MTRREYVVLLNDDGEAIGTADKATVHDESTALHLAFSCHVFNAEGQVLVTRRALTKRTWPGVWTNSFCGHPAPGEHMLDALTRRAEQELGLAVEDVVPAIADFRYRAVDAGGVVENEICPVYTATTRAVPVPQPDEVMDWRWEDPHHLGTALVAVPWAFSPWLTLQFPLLPAAGASQPAR